MRPAAKRRYFDFFGKRPKRHERQRRPTRRVTVGKDFQNLIGKYTPTCKELNNYGAKRSALLVGICRAVSRN
jgi:hypothetical protein